MPVGGAEYSSRGLQDDSVQQDAAGHSHEATWCPGNPAVIGIEPLDRKFCAPAFRRGCSCVAQDDAAARRPKCSCRATRVNVLIPLKIAAWAQTRWHRHTHDLCLSWATGSRHCVRSATPTY